MHRKRIDLLAPPFSGHLHPILALARALDEEYDVRVLSTENAQSAIRAAGVAGVSLLDDSDGRLLEIVNPAHAVGSHPVRLHRQFQRTLGVLQELRLALRERYATERPDLVIADFTLPVAGVVAAELGIPWWTSLPSPCAMETPDGPPGYLGGIIPGRSWAGHVRNGLGRRLVRSFKRVTFAMYRKEIAAAGVLHLYRADSSEAVYSPERVLALGMEELEFPRTWPPAVTFLGPLLYTPPSEHPAPRFAEGRRHVLVTLGTHLHWAKDRMALEVERVARSQPAVTFHFSDGRHAGDVSERENFVRLSYVDYDRHLPRYDLVVHHGGAGVMYHCLRHGKPAVVHPIDYDQFDHAARLEAAGVAIWLRKLPALGATIDATLRSEGLRTRCAEFAVHLSNYHPEQAIKQLVTRQFSLETDT